MACESYFKVVELIFYSNNSILDPQKGGRQHGLGTLWPHGKIKFWYQKCNIFIGLKVLQNRACVPAMKNSPKGEFLHNDLHDNVI